MLEYVQGAGFVGIAVALMGRSHPLGIALAALLFGLLYQGGTELSFAKPDINRDMIVQLVYQGLAEVATGPFPRNKRGYLELPPYGFDTERARQLLDDAHYDRSRRPTLYVTATRSADIEASQRTGTLWAVETDASGPLRLRPGAL